MTKITYFLWHEASWLCYGQFTNCAKKHNLRWHKYLKLPVFKYSNCYLFWVGYLTFSLFRKCNTYFIILFPLKSFRKWKHKLCLVWKKLCFFFFKGICLLVIGSKEAFMTNVAGISCAVTCYLINSVAA